MALVSHTIRSHYDPRNHVPELEQLDASLHHTSWNQTLDSSDDALPPDPSGAETHTQQSLAEIEQLSRLKRVQDVIEAEVENEREWNGAARLPWHRPRLRGPVFVPASSSDASDASAMANEKSVGGKGEGRGKGKEREDVSGWYASLTSRPGSRVGASQGIGSTTTTTSISSIPDSAQASANPEAHEARLPSISTSHSSSSSAPSTSASISKPNWFSTSSSSAFSHVPSTTTVPRQETHASSLADMLSRNPPPLPSESPFVPPVFLGLNPSNRGWKMLERCGWREGEGVGGVGSVQHRPGDGQVRTVRPAREEALCKEEPVVIDLTGVDEPTTIDLTISDDEEGGGDCDGDGSDGSSTTMDDDDDDGTMDMMATDGEESSVFPSHTNTNLTHPKTHGHIHTHDHRTTLLTPLPTIVKTDRLGIGLRARTQNASGSNRHAGSRSMLSHIPSGTSTRYSVSSSRRSTAAPSSTTTSSYRVPVKVTNLTPSFTRHLESIQAAKRRRERVGRGRRGFEREYKKAESDRRQLIAYMNE